MQGIVALLDEVHTHVVRSLWRELASTLGEEVMQRRAVPHVTLHAAPEGYHSDGLLEALSEFSARHPPVEAVTTGLGLFTPSHVMHIPVVRSAALNTLHRDLEATLTSFTTEQDPLYLSDTWVPHITLGLLEHHHIEQAVDLFADRGFRWELTIARLALLEADSSGHTILFQTKLRGGG